MITTRNGKNLKQHIVNQINLVTAVFVVLVVASGKTTAQTQTWNVGAASNIGGVESVKATLSEGTLTISGTGAMMDYHSQTTNPRPPWFWDNITTVVIEEGVTSIGIEAFLSRTGLTSVTIGNSVTTIGQGAFSYCTGLTSVTIPNSVTTIGQGAFSYCTGLTSVTIGNSVTSIGSSAFGGCTGLTSVTIPNSVTSIGGSAFGGCTGLTSVTIPNSVTSIGGSAFGGCTGLTSINVDPNNANFSSEDGVLFNKNKTTLIQYPAGKQGTLYTIPNSVTSIGSSAFYGCTGLTSVTIPNSVTSIGDDAFRGCIGLTSVTIPNSVTYIGWNAFNGCTGLTSVTIPESVTSIRNNAFLGCTGLTSINVDMDNASYSSEDGVLFSKSKNNLILYPQGRQGSYTIPNSVTSIGDRAFYGCTGLASVTIGNSVTSIRDRAFYGCTGLASVTIGNSVTSIGDGAFYGCTGLASVTISNSVTFIGDGAFGGCRGLTSITIPNSVTYIGDSAFSGCTGLTSVTIGNSVTTIGVHAFNGCTGLTSVTIGNSVTSIRSYAFSGCTSLRSITVLNPIPPSIQSSTFMGLSPNTARLNLPQGSAALYGGANFWKEFHIPTGVWDCGTIPGTVSATLDEEWTLTISGAGAMMDYGQITPPWVSKNFITSVVIEDGVTTIGNWAFGGCTGLTSVTIPNSVTSIGDYAFSRCTGLTSVTIGNSVTSIGDRAFYGCTGLASVTIGNSVTSIGNDAFYGCTGLTSVTIGNSVTSIGNYAFSGCTGLTSVTIPNSVTSIGNYAFSGCTGLTSVTIPNSVTSIGYYAFSRCTGLTSVTIGNSVTTIGIWAFDNCRGLTSINVGPDNANFSSEDGVLFNKNKTTLRQYPAGKQGTSYTIPNSVTNIVEEAFHGCTGLTSINVDPNNANFSSEDGVLFNKNKTTLRQYPAGKQGSYTIPNSVFFIGSYAFSGCTGLTSVTIPNSVTTIRWHAFSGCTGLTSVISLRATPPLTDGGAWPFNYINPTVCLYVPQSSIAAYRATGPWSSFSCINSISELGYRIVTFNSQGGSAVDSQPVLIDSKAAKPTAPTLPDYTFMGWYKEAAYTNLWDFDNDAVTADVTLYAKWLKSLTANMLSIPTVTYNAIPHIPNLTVTDGTKTLVINTDYTVTLNSQTNAGTYPVTVTGIGDYTGTRAVNFVINPKPLTSDMLYIPTVEFDGTPKTPGLTVADHDIGGLVRNIDFTATLTPQTVVGTYLITVTGMGNYMGTQSVNFIIIPKDVSVLSQNRIIPGFKPNEETALNVSVNVLTNELTAGPNPVARSMGSVNFFWQGKKIQSATLTIFDASGNVINKVKITDNALNTQERSPVGSWDLTDSKGRLVSEGTYLVRGTVITSDGKRERVSVMVGVR